MELNLVEKVIALEGVELMSGLEPDLMANIAAIATEVHFLPGRPILEETKPLDALYIIVDGSVELTRDGVPVDTAGVNAVLGAWALFHDKDPVRIGATAREDTRVLSIGWNGWCRRDGRAER
jgi:CRP-like cAMP-binding protein